MKTRLLAAALFALALGCSKPADYPLPQNSPAHNQAGNASHSGHSDPVEFNWDELAPPAANGAAVDLKNTKDPVTLKPVGAVTYTYKGFIAHFESEQTLAKFKKKPLKYLNLLSLEPHVDGSVERVEAASFQDAVTEYCPVMTESQVDPHGTVYLLHRGWKFFFCCWTGCGDAFMQNPKKYYAWYGLVERDGKLVREK